MNKYLKNPYVIIGLVGLGFYLYKRRQILSEQPEAEKSVNEIDHKKEILDKTFDPLGRVEDLTTEEPKDNFAGVPEKLKRDSAKMSNQTLKRTIITNQKMLKRARLSDGRRKQLIKALEYLKQEYKIRKN